MLTSLRKAAGTWVAKVLLGLLILSFAVWGISGSIFGGPGTAVVTAGDTNVSVVEYRLAYDRQVAQLSQQFGTRLTREQASSLGIDQQVLSQLVAGAVLDEQASQMGLGLSRDRLAILAAQDPAFRGPNGRFDRSQFDFVLRQVGMTPDEYLRNREQVAVRQQIVEAVSDDVRVPDIFLRALALYQGETRTIEYVTIPRSGVEPVEAPDEAALSAYFEENAQRYGAPEYRTVSFVQLEPQRIADAAAVGQEAVAAHYEENRTFYSEPERRRIEQIIFPNEEAAREAARQIEDGATFEEIVEAQGRTMNDVLLGTFNREDVADPAIAEAAFTLEEGGVSDVVRGNFGHLIVRVPEILPETVRPLAELEDEIREELALEEATRILYDVHDEYEDARAAGETLVEAAGRLNLQVESITIDNSGAAPDGGEPELPAVDDFLQQVFETDEGIENAPLNIGNAGFLYFEVEEIVAARNRTLDEIRERVVSDWTAQEVDARLSERAADIEQALIDGRSLQEVAEAQELAVQTKRGLRRDSDDSDLGRAGVAAVFAVEPNGVGTTPAADTSVRVVFKVTEAAEPLGADASSIDPQMVDGLSNGLADDLLDQLVARLQSEYRVTVNQSAIRQALSF